VSLINKMLKDLEARQHPPLGRATPKPIYEDLRPVIGEPPPRDRRLALFMLVCGAVLLAAGIVVWNHWRVRIYRSTQPTAASAHFFVPPAAPAVGPHAAVAHPVPSGDATVSARVSATSVHVQHTVSHTSAATYVAAQHKIAHARPSVRPRQRAKAVSTRVAVFAAAPAPQAAPKIPPDAAVDASQVEKKEIPLTSGQNAENSYRQGARLLEQGRRTQAEQTLKSALTINPKHVKARELLAGLLLEDGRWPEVEQLLEQGLVVLPRQTAFIYLLARVDVEHGAEPKAIGLLESGLPDASADAEYLALLATLYQRAGRNADAIKTFSQALALRPLEGKWWLGLGISLEAQKNWAEAREAYTRAKFNNLDPDLAKFADERLSAIRYK